MQAWASMVQEEEQRELEMKQLEAARYEQEIKMAQREAEEEKIRRKQAYQRSACLCQDVQSSRKLLLQEAGFVKSC